MLLSLEKFGVCANVIKTTKLYFFEIMEEVVAIDDFTKNLCVRKNTCSRCSRSITPIQQGWLPPCQTILVERLVPITTWTDILSSWSCGICQPMCFIGETEGIPLRWWWWWWKNLYFCTWCLNTTKRLRIVK